MSEPALRLFVALDLPDEARVELVHWRASVVAAQAGLRAVGDESLHVTLCFLGSLPGGAVPGILDACGELSGMEAPHLTLAEALWLAPRRPHVLAVSVRDAESRLAAVQSKLSGVLSAGGWYVPEARPFLAHVTVARVRRGARVRPVELPAPAPVAFRGRAVVLYRSRLGRGGAHYEALGRVQLGPSLS